jgi:hypothetical protein
VVNLCPFCGIWLDRPVHDGITSCQHCNRVFDDSPKHRFLAATWLLRKHRDYDQEWVADQYTLSKDQVETLRMLVIDGCYSHDEVLKHVKGKGGR